MGRSPPRVSRLFTAMRRLSATLVFVALAAIAALACEQALGIDGPVVVDTHEACGLPISDSSCKACLASKCCGEAHACASDSVCSTEVSCRLGCGSDYACRSICELDEPHTFSPNVPPIETCAAQNCDDACGTTCGVDGTLTEPDASASCQACIVANMCSQAESCTTDLACESLLWCGFSCNTVDCGAACAHEYSSVAFQSYELALGSSCLTACQLGRQFSCVGHVDWPFAKSNTQTATLTLTLSETGAPLEGIVAKSCAPTDQPCLYPFDQETSDANGNVTLNLPGTSAGFDGFDGYFDLAGPGGLTTLLFTTAPLSEPNALLATPLLSLTSFESLASSVGVTLDPSLGHIRATAVDCVGVPAPDVAITAQGIGPETKLMYYENGELDPSAVATAQSGVAVVFNVPANVVTIAATPLALGRVSSTETVFARAGALSLITLAPTPNP